MPRDFLIYKFITSGWRNGKMLQAVFIAEKICTWDKVE
jgi:hypothetical protein